MDEQKKSKENENSNYQSSEEIEKSKLKRKQPKTISRGILNVTVKCNKYTDLMK